MGVSGRCVQLTAHLHLVRKLRMSGAILPPSICLHTVHKDFSFSFTKTEKVAVLWY